MARGKNAVALLIIDGQFLCSGALINTTKNDNTPYLLTASHCLNGHDAINNANCDYWTFLWDYESPNCENPTIEPIRLSTSGAIVKANNSVSDFALLQLTEDPRNIQSANLYYLGWDNSGNFGNSGVGIHHPRGDIKKIATLETTSNLNNSDNFWKFYWNSTPNGYSVTVVLLVLLLLIISILLDNSTVEAP